MDNVLYLDVYIGVNLMADIFLLYVTGKLRGKRMNVRRILLGAACGTVWSSAIILCRILLPAYILRSGHIPQVWLALLRENPVLWQKILMMTEKLLTWVPAAAGMIFLTYREKKIKDLCATLMTLWLVTAAAGGIFYAWMGSGMQMNGGRGQNVQALSWITFFLWILGGFFAFRFFLPIAGKWFEKKHLYQVTLRREDKTATVTALWDTGNRLYEPYTHRPVHVVSSEVCGDWLDVSEGMILIPYRSVGRGHGLLPGIQLDEMKIEQNGEPVAVYKKPWIAISREQLSEGREYQMLLHGEK